MLCAVINSIIISDFYKTERRMKMKRVLPIILVLCMVLAMLVGCGNTASTAEDTASAAASVAEAPAEAPEAEPEEEAVPETPASAAEEASVAEESIEEQPTGTVTPGKIAQTAVLNGEIDRVKQLPLTEDSESLSYWITTSFGSSSGISSWNDHYGLKKAQELTGVTLEITEHNMVSASEQFNLMIASNDLCDIIVGFENNYSVGADNAIEEEELIIDLKDYIEYAPIYQQLLEVDPAWQADMETDGGHLASFKMLYTEDQWVKQSVTLRGDWLNELGMELPVTFDDYHEVLLAFKSEYDPAYCLNIGTSLGNNWFEPGFGIAVSASGSATSNDFYVEDDVVYAGYTSDRFRDYLTMLHEWYEDGIISSDYVSVGNLEFFENDFSAYASAGEFGCIMGPAGLLSLYASMSDDPDFEFVGGILPRNNEDETLTYLTESTLTGSDWAPSISATGNNIPLAMNFLDFFYTEEGSMIANYGLEGESYTIENGEIKLTDLILNAGDTNGALMAYKTSLSSIGDPNAGFALTSTAEGIAIMKAWTEDQTALAAMGNNAIYPSGVSLTSEELTEASNVLSDIATYVSEAVPGFIMGTKSLDEWDSYCADLEAMDLAAAVEIYQAAYDRYIG